MYFDLLFTDGGLEIVSGAQPRSAVGCSVLLAHFVFADLNDQVAQKDHASSYCK
ncbi:hypothetical protein [Rubritalea tangerina]|uniref:hypothetical protein n=1 Tax=Rubritalea tangerina TaxID=430798 RepID=UPI0036119F5F